jgi:hypothetical protein
VSDVQPVQAEVQTEVQAETRIDAGLGLGISRRSLMEAAGALLCLAGAGSMAQAQPAPSGGSGTSRRPLFTNDLPDLALKGW